MPDLPQVSRRGNGGLNMNKIKYLLKDANFKNILLITAALVIILTSAAAFIYLYGKSETISIETSAKTRETGGSATEEKASSSDTVFVDVSGCIKTPGVYELPYGSRIFEAIEKAGGFTKHADRALINQAETITDGMKINVPDKRDSKGSGSNSAAQGSGNGASDTGTLININTAGSEELQQISGIGPVTAEKIIQYREENGAFGSVEDITNVSGIGEKTLEKMKPQITV